MNSANSLVSLVNMVVCSIFFYSVDHNRAVRRPGDTGRFWWGFDNPFRTVVVVYCYCACYENRCFV